MIPTAWRRSPRRRIRAGRCRRLRRPVSDSRPMSADDGAMPNRTPRPRILMICAHEPGLAPRIRGEAEGAGPCFEVTVLGFNRDDGSLPGAETMAGYRLVRMPRRQVSGIRYLWRLRTVMPTPVIFLFGMLLVPVAPLIFLAELGVRLLR